MGNKAAWERQETDTDKSFEAFCVYRDMGSNRSLREVAQRLSKSATIINRWSSAHDWVNRVSAYDDDQREQTRIRLEQARLEVQMDALNDYKAIRKAIGKRLEILDQTGYKGSPSELHDLIAIMERVNAYVRLNTGLPDKITTSTSQVSGKLETRSTNVNMETHTPEEARGILKDLEELGILPNGTSAAVDQAKTD
jgi:hypothetical protein